MATQEQLAIELKNQQIILKKLEHQLLQIQQTQTARSQGGLPSDSEPPKQVMEITLRNGKEFNEEPLKTTSNGNSLEEWQPQVITNLVLEHRV